MSLCLNGARSGQDIVWPALKIIWNAKRDVGEGWAKKIWGDAMCNCITEIMGRRRREDKTIRHFLSHFVRENKDAAWLIISSYCFVKAKNIFSFHFLIHSNDRFSQIWHCQDNVYVYFGNINSRLIFFFSFENINCQYIVVYFSFQML